MRQPSCLLSTPKQTILWWWRCLGGRAGALTPDARPTREGVGIRLMPPRGESWERMWRRPRWQEVFPKCSPVSRCPVAPHWCTRILWRNALPPDGCLCFCSVRFDSWFLVSFGWRFHTVSFSSTCFFSRLRKPEGPGPCSSAFEDFPWIGSVWCLPCETSVSLTGSDSSAVVLGFVSNARHGSSMVPLPLCLPRMHDGIPSPRLPRLGLTGGDRPNIHDTGS